MTDSQLRTVCCLMLCSPSHFFHQHNYSRQITWVSATWMSCNDYFPPTDVRIIENDHFKHKILKGCLFFFIYIIPHFMFMNSFLSSICKMFFCIGHYCCLVTKEPWKPNQKERTASCYICQTTSSWSPRRLWKYSADWWEKSEIFWKFECCYISNKTKTVFH